MEEITRACAAVVEMLAPSAASESYNRKIRKSFGARTIVCEAVGRQALEQGVDPMLAIAVAMVESRFTDVLSKKGAKGPMGVIPKYTCPRKGVCNYIEAGVRALKIHLDNNHWDYCQSLAQFNRGVAGVCEEGRSEFRYANAVLDVYAYACQHSDSCHTC